MPIAVLMTRTLAGPLSRVCSAGSAIVLALTVSSCLAGCTPVPEEPESEYFRRLLERAAPNDIRPYDLTEPLVAQSTAGPIADLLADGFEPRISDDGLSEKIQCEGLPLVKVNWGEYQNAYALRLVWGNDFSTAGSFTIDLYLDEDCLVVGVGGGRNSQLSF